MSQERLEEIKKELELDWSDISYVVNQNDVKWLVNRVGELEQQNKRYREVIENIKWKVNKELESLGITEDEQELQKVRWLSALMTICIEALESGY